MTTLIHLALSLMLLTGSAEVVVITLPSRGSVTLPLGAAGKAELKREATVSRVKIEIESVAQPSTFGPALNTFVVWAVSPDGSFENIGELALEKDKALIEATTRFEQIGILITAEPHYMVDRPSAAVAFRSQDPKNGDPRRVSVSIDVGAYDYSSIKVAPQTGVSPLVMEARTAFQIAQNTGADRWAEAELRHAKIALDTLEEILGRAAPVEVVSRSANEAIRLSQQAVMAARERSAADALQTARAEGAGLRQDKQSLEARVQQLTQQLAAANSQIQKLQSDLATAGRDNQNVAQQLDQVSNRERTTSRELADLKKRQEDLQSFLSLRLRDDFYVVKTKSLSPAAREALSRLSGIATVVPGQIRIEGPASDDLFAAARQFLVSTGISEERILLVR